MKEEKMKVLIACEFSGVARDAFINHGHDAWSCDFLDPEGEHIDKHFKTNVLNLLQKHWDLMVAFPPCTYLAVSGARWFNDPSRKEKQRAAIYFVHQLICSPIPKIAIENPVSLVSTVFGPPNQIIHPWQFGHGETKTTCLWLRNLPPLKPTHIVSERQQRVHLMPPSPERSKDRGRTYPGIAEAMATQWTQPKKFGFFNR